MQVQVHHHTNILVTSIEGRFDAHGIERFTTEVVDQIGAGHRNLIVDLSHVEFMDSSALAGLVKALKRTMEHNGSIVLTGVADAARIILELTRLDEVFPQAPSVEDARRLLATAG